MLTDADRDQILATIVGTIGAWKDDPAERRHLLDTLSFVSARTHEAQAVAEIKLLALQLRDLLQQVAMLQKPLVVIQ